MRRAAERLLRDHHLFESIDGSAEDTTLADESVDLVVVANALHWVDRDAARAEFSRILRPGGRVAVVWYVARESGTPFLRDHADLMSACMTGTGAGGAEDARAMTRAFFGDGPGGQRGYEVATFPYPTAWTSPRPSCVWLAADTLCGPTASTSATSWTGDRRGASTSCAPSSSTPRPGCGPR